MTPNEITSPHMPIHSLEYCRIFRAADCRGQDVKKADWRYLRQLQVIYRYTFGKKQRSARIRRG